MISSRFKTYFFTCSWLALFAVFFDLGAYAADELTPINLFEELEKVQNEALNDEISEGSSKSSDNSEVEEVVSPEARYQIELLIFAYVNTGEENSEVWRNLPRPSFDAYFTPVQSAENTVTSPILAKPAPRIFLDTERDGVSSFKGIMRKMQINGQYRVLKHLVWQQAVFPEETQDFIYIRGGNSYPFKNHLTDMAMSDPGNMQTDFAENMEPLGQYELEGIIRIHLSRFLHIRSDLWFTQYALNDAGICYVSDSPEAYSNKNLKPPRLSYTPLLNFQLNQNRRMRSNELHYLDHPRFGLLVKFTPLKKP